MKLATLILELSTICFNLSMLVIQVKRYRRIRQETKEQAQRTAEHIAMLSSLDTVRNTPRFIAYLLQEQLNTLFLFNGEQ